MLKFLVCLLRHAEGIKLQLQGGNRYNGLAIGIKKCQLNDISKKCKKNEKSEIKNYIFHTGYEPRNPGSVIIFFEFPQEEWQNYRRGWLLRQWYMPNSISSIEELPAPFFTMDLCQQIKPQTGSPDVICFLPADFSFLHIPSRRSASSFGLEFDGVSY